ncbi:MAG: hypothetical protein KY461_13590 [Actinobacteria bacterium]|nr:hypothetical protein [Actinomycetota bacterium]
MSRRTILTAVLALSAFGLTAGLTASMTVTSDQLGSGTTEAITACDADGVNVAYGVSPGANGLVSEVTLEGVAAACDSDDLVITLLDAVGATLDSYDGSVGTLTGGATTVTLTGGAPAASVAKVTVVITG